ncbi:DUF3823 domain-containing protein [Flavisolibacter nicotianae]|uniref:DUF3823 domain-containing protein n=1 Tax=Flavisolibacter nicotianae TaxID=2364882 RepID=UPI000EAC2824|nr:DUF3823 domain-containing protein [Flavisolibacter nicotianae]
MKRHFLPIALAVFCLAAFSCKKDNYEEPKSKLTGKFHYKGEAIQVQYDQVPFELYQDGFGKVGPINGALTQEGTYSHVLFDGDYKLVVRAGQGPFYWPQTGGKSDTLLLSVKGDTQRDIEVEPYYMIRSPQISKTGGNVTATFKIEKIITDAARAKDVQTATLFINKTQFVSGNDNIARTNIAGSAIADPNNVSLSVAIPTISPTQNYVFARIGVKIAGVEDWIFSPVVKITF